MADLSAAREAFLAKRRNWMVAEDSAEGIMLDAHAAVERHQGPSEQCATCKGFGLVPRRVGPDEGDVDNELCDACHGTGKVPGRWWPNRETHAVYDWLRTHNVGLRLDMKQYDARTFADWISIIVARQAGIPPWRPDASAIADALREG